MILKPEETELIGSWVKSGSSIIGDAVEERITILITSHLEKIAISPASGGWEIIYRDPVDGRFWELTHPQSGMHGGGPKRLICLPTTAASAKYRLNDHGV